MIKPLAIVLLTTGLVHLRSDGSFSFVGFLQSQSSRVVFLADCVCIARNGCVVRAESADDTDEGSAEVRVPTFVVEAPREAAGLVNAVVKLLTSEFLSRSVHRFLSGAVLLAVGSLGADFMIVRAR